jgi:mannose-1-phosphate guanylyltransferase
MACAARCSRSGTGRTPSSPPSPPAARRASSSCTRSSTAGAVRFAARETGIAERFLALNGDVLSDIDLGALVAFHDKLGAAATIALTPVEDPSAFGVVVTDADGWVRAFVEKPPRQAAPSRFVNAGAYVLEPEVLERIPEGRAVSIERETFPGLVADRALAALGSTAYWIDTGTPAALLAANLDIVAGVRGLPPARGARAVREGVYVLGQAVLEGEVLAPVLLGERAVVEAGAVVRRAVVGGGAVVRAGARVVGSVLFPGARVGEGAVVEDSIVGRSAAVGERAVLRAGSVVANGATVAEGSVLEGCRVGPPGALGPGTVT